MARAQGSEQGTVAPGGPASTSERRAASVAGLDPSDFTEPFPVHPGPPEGFETRSEEDQRVAGGYVLSDAFSGFIDADAAMELVEYLDPEWGVFVRRSALVSLVEPVQFDRASDDARATAESMAFEMLSDFDWRIRRLAMITSAKAGFVIPESEFGRAVMSLRNDSNEQVALAAEIISEDYLGVSRQPPEGGRR
ncbi:MAG: hypothetical protein AAGG07_08815 [Planctomycetota bacterium]